MAWDRKAPFTKDGSLMNYVGPGQSGIEWRDADTPMQMTLTFVEFKRGRSAAHSIWKDEHGNEFTMFLADLQDLLQTGATKTVTGKWVVTKRGQDFGIKQLQPR